jgi:hypothetical protein
MDLRVWLWMDYDVHCISALQNRAIVSWVFLKGFNDHLYALFPAFVGIA